MGWMEIAATAATLLCVLLAVKRRVAQFPVGLAATTLFFFVFLGARLYSSAALQIVFTAVQLYGWWYWLRGDRGRRPAIGRVGAARLAAAIAAAGLASAVLGLLLNSATDARMALLDAQIFGQSLLAQFLLDRKKIENWIVWSLVNAASVFTYATQGLRATTALYLALLINCLWGWREWRDALERQARA